MTEMEAPLISFVVPCYNYARYLGECVASILEQQGDYAFEVILIDDASTDETVALLKSFVDPRIRVVYHEVNQGHAKTVAEGLRLSRGKYAARIDPDDRYRRNFLSLTMPLLEKHPEVGAVYGDVALIDERGEITAERSDREHNGRDFKGNELVQLLEKNFICAPSLIARREAWINALPVPEGLAFNDWYFTLMMARKYEFYYLNQVLADYRVHAANHHTKVVREKTEEPSIFWLLDHIFSTPEGSATLQAAKRRAQRRIYGAQFLDMAEKYFGYGYNEDARRCYLAAFRKRPSLLFEPGPVRRFAATLLGRKMYESSKSRLKTARGSVARALR